MLKGFKLNNQTHGITGMLFYRSGHFLQVIEGDNSIVETLYEKICSDSRHNAIKTLLEGDIDTRMFGHWDMAYKKVEEIKADIIDDVDQIIDTYKELDFMEQGIILKVIKGFYFRP